MDTILQDMQLTTDYCSLGHALRKKLNIPVSYPLYEAHINGNEGIGFLSKDFIQLIQDELNIDHIEPFISTFSQFAETKEIEKNGLKIIVDVSQDHYLQRRHEKRKARSEENQNRKKQGLEYAEKQSK